MGNERDNILASISSIYQPSLAKDDVRSPGGALNWMRCIDVFNVFVSQDSKEPLVITMPVTVLSGDQLLRVRKNYVASTMTLEQAHKELALIEEADEEEEQLPISQLQDKRERLEPTESIVLLGMVDPKGKAPDNPSSKPKKRKLVKVST